MRRIETFKWDAYKLDSSSSSDLIKNPIMLAVLLLQVIVLAIGFSCFNFNILSPIYITNHVERIGFLIFSFVLIYIQNIFHRQHSIGIATSFACLFLSHFIFSYYFIQPFTHLIKIDNKRSIFSLKKIMLHANLIFSLLNCAAFSAHLTFTNFFIRTRLVYTQTSGLFSYIKSKLNSSVLEAKNMFKTSLKINILTFICYSVAFGTLIKILLLFVGVSVFYLSTIEVLVHLLMLCINNAVFYFATRLIEDLSIFNNSFYEPHISCLSKCSQRDIEALEYHKLIQKYKSGEIKLKTHSKESMIVEKSMVAELKELNEVLDFIEAAKNMLDSKLFVTVPQAQRRYTKKYKVYNSIDMLLNKLYYELQCFVLVNRFKLVCETLPDTIEFVLSVKKNENIQLITQSTIHQFEVIVERATAISSKLGLKLCTDELSDVLKRLY